MVEFVLTHPDYLLLMFLCFFLVVKVIFHIIGEKPGNDDDGSDGGIQNEDPVLDLPPGVSLPGTKPEKDLVF